VAARATAGNPAKVTATGGPDPSSGTVVHSYVAGPDGTKTPKTVDWSQARYLDYAYLSIAVHPAPPGGIASLQITARSDLDQEIDRVELLCAYPSQPSNGPREIPEPRISQ
jgi:hypothetical protein